MADPRVAAIPVRECGEPLVDVRSGPAALLVDGRRSDPDGAFAHLRQHVRDQLVEAQRQLPGGLRLLVVEGYGPRPCSRSTSSGTRRAFVYCILTGRRRMCGPQRAASCRPRRSPRTVPAPPLI